MSLTPGTRIGPYEVQELIGSGGMGHVFKAHDTRLGRTVALKILRTDRPVDEERRRRFMQEARAASALNHPHIVVLHDILSENGSDVLVMEYVPGKTLDQVIPKKGLRLQDTLRYGIQIADALAAAHHSGIVHRDLKPVEHPRSPKRDPSSSWTLGSRSCSSRSGQARTMSPARSKSRRSRRMGQSWGRRAT